MRVSSRANKGQFTSVRFGKEPKPAAKPRQPRQPAPVAADVAIPAISIDNPINDEINHKIKILMDELTTYWRETFYTPNDYITDKYFEVVEYYDKLPATMQSGLANLEVKESEPIKHTPLLSKLINGDYQTAQSKSDNNIATSIKFFINNLPSFQQYKDQDKLDWVVNHHRLLSYELLFYSLNHNSSVATLKSKFNAITRIIRLSYKSKSPDLYEKFSRIVSDLGHYFEDDEFNNELSPEELKKFIVWDEVIAKQKSLENQFYSIQNKHTKMAYDINNDLLLLSLYSLIPPLRNEVKHLDFTHTKKDDGDYIWFSTDGNVLLDLNLEKKRHEPIQFNLSRDAPQLAALIQDSYKLYPREFVFTPKNTYPKLDKKASQSSLDTRLSVLFWHTGKNVSVNSLRSSYVSYMVHQGMVKGKLLTVKEKNKIAEKMRSSRKYLDESYTKLFQIDQPQPQLNIKVEESINNNTIDETSTYERQKKRASSYYHTHKTDILQKQKEYQKNKGSYENSRSRLLRFLNSSPEYENTMRDTTKTKYNFKKVNGLWE
jgi:hypothetical protein